jgi:hypothetical protein
MKINLTGWRPLLCFVAPVLWVSGAVAQESYFDFSFSGSGYSGSGVLGGTTLGGGEYLINSVSGTANGGQPLSLLSTATPWTGTPACAAGSPCYASNGFVYDNVLNMGSHGVLLDPDGLGLLTPGNNGINIGQITGVNGYFYSDDALLAGGTNPNGYVPIKFSATFAAPEIDAASAVSGLTLLLGSLVVLCGRRTARPDCAAA